MSNFTLDGMRVLVMEDEFLIALDVEQICRDHGAADVVIVSNIEALGPDPFAHQTFHAAVLDLMLSGKPTLDFAAQLLERAVPFVFATGHSQSDNFFDRFQGIPVVGKPYSGRDLLDALAAAFERVAPQLGSA